ncbi:MAG: hypothetical protein ABTD50_24265 [Polyangiaceae bacterium]|jgi:hypothetical protein
MSPANRNNLGDALFVSWAALLYGLLVTAQSVRDKDSQEVYGVIALLWLGLSLWGLGRVAFILIRAALPAPESRRRS